MSPGIKKCRATAGGVGLAIMGSFLAPASVVLDRFAVFAVEAERPVLRLRKARAQRALVLGRPHVCRSVSRLVEARVNRMAKNLEKP